MGPNSVLAHLLGSSCKEQLWCKSFCRRPEQGETRHLVIGTAIDEIKYWATALAVGSVKLQSSARGSGKLNGLDAEDRLAPPHSRKETKKILLFFFFFSPKKKLELLLVKIGNYMSVGVLFSLQKIIPALGNLSFTLKTEF